MTNQYEIKLVVLGYLQLIPGQKIKDNVQYNLQQEASFIIKTLKSIAFLINIKIVALTQMLLDIENRTTGQILADLRESGVNEQEADIVSFLYHPEFDNLGKEDQIGQEIKESITNINYVGIKFIISKQRNGELTILKKIGYYFQEKNINEIEKI